MTSLARPTLVQGAAVAAAAMAVLLAAEAWSQLQQPDGSAVSPIGAIGHSLPMIALPLVAVCIGLACSWLMRRARFAPPSDVRPTTAAPASGAAPELRDPVAVDQPAAGPRVD